MKSPDVLTGDELLYSVHRSLKDNKPHLGNPLLDLQFILFPRVFYNSITGKITTYGSLTKTEGFKLAGHMELTRAEAIYFTKSFSTAAAKYVMTGLCEEMVLRYAFLRTRLIYIVDEGFKEKPEEKLLVAPEDDYQDDEEELTLEERKRIEEDITRLFAIAFGVGEKHIEQWRNILLNAGRSLSTTFLETTLDLPIAKSKIEGLQRQL